VNHKQVAYVLLRITFGVVFLFYGIEKFMIGRATVASSIVKDFEKTPLPRVLVSLFGNSLPFVEVILGLCVLFGIFTTIALALMAALLGVLTFGQVLLLNGQIIANNLLHCVIAFLLLFFAEHNTLCLDDLWRKREER
jgi:thiosulfate dehydrogenase [quinone] large subunit